MGWKDGRQFRGGVVDRRVGWVGLVGFCGRFGDKESRGKYGCGGLFNKFQILALDFDVS